MSQEGILDIISAHPEIPTDFIANVGAATPALNELNIFATSVAADGIPAQTVGSGNTITTQIQRGSSQVSSSASNAGLVSFNSAQFTVDGNGFVMLSTPGGVESFIVQKGTSPVTSSAGLITFNGAVVAAGTNPVQTDGTSAHTMALEVQLSQAIGSSDPTKVGLAAFNSTQFTVDVNGFVSVTTTGFINTLTGNSGGAIAPVANNINTVGTGSIIIAGLGNTLTTQLTGLTNHAVLVGAGTATITNIAATANTGAILQNNSGTDPSYSTATYPSTTTINQILYSSAANVISGLATANRAMLTTGTTGIPVLTALATDGQLIIGSTAGVPAASTLTAGTGISITNASNSITIAVSGSVVGQTITGQTGGALSPTAGNWTIQGNGVSGSGTSTAGNIFTTGSGSTLTINSTQAQFMTNYTNVNHAASPYTVLATDMYLSVDSSGGAVSLLFPNAPTANRHWIVKDRTGNAGTNNITLTTVGGAVNIDGSTSQVMSANYMSVQLVANATPTYEII